eukprot:c16695_g1_i1.p2 GENE.c16695_g1_i1~~c16695_g1_i1.p2  ORF type:complete len:100 (-),score=12.79 c16695_g1_i1:129-428(-)
MVLRGCAKNDLCALSSCPDLKNLSSPNINTLHILRPAFPELLYVGFVGLLLCCCFLLCCFVSCSFYSSLSLSAPPAGSSSLLNQLGNFLFFEVERDLVD